MGSKEDDIIEIFDSDSNEAKIAAGTSGRVRTKRKSEQPIEVFSSSDETEESESEDEVQCIDVSDTESEPEYDCDVWDRDCRIVNVPVKTPKIRGFHLLPTCLPEPDAKQMKLSVEFTDELTDESFVKEFKEAWKSDAPLVKDAHELITDPFKLCIVKNLIHNTSLLDEVRQEFNEIDWNHRNLDLYELFQSRDLKYLDEYKYIKMVYDFLKTDVMKWVSELTGLELTKISATCSYYADTNYLLVHDDQQDDRMVAFVLYLTGKEGWKPEWGGALQMFSRTEQDQPDVPARDIVPANNQFVFFPVTNKSYHQVEEVTSKNYCRLSINGWFHADNPPKFESPVYTIPATGIYSNKALLPISTDIIIEDWIENDYLNAGTVQDIQEQIEESSEISLQDYFKEDMYNKVLAALTSDDVKWKRFGPSNRRSYEVLVEENLPDILKQFLNLFRSREMFALLEGYTELELASKTGTMRYEMQRWSPGSYSLLSDDYEWHAKSELDLVIYFGCESKSDIIGGKTQYIGTEEKVQQALITLDPEPNTLNIVFRDTARVTRHVSKLSKISHFYMLICSYSE